MLYSRPRRFRQEALRKFHQEALRDKALRYVTLRYTFYSALCTPSRNSNNEPRHQSNPNKKQEIRAETLITNREISVAPGKGKRKKEKQTKKTNPCYCKQ